VVPVATRPQLELLRYALTHAEGEDPALFLPWQNVRRDLREACKRAGIPPCSPNDLRRTFATWLRAAGAPTDLIAPVMGHADTRMVERVYGRLAPSDLRRRIDGLRGRSRCVTGVSDTVEALGLFAPSGRPAPRRRSFKFACFPVPRDGVEPPTRGFSSLCLLWPNPLFPRARRKLKARPASIAHQSLRKVAAGTRPRG
jgi:hypothetical protein